MGRRHDRRMRICLLIVVLLTLPACGLKYNVKMRVVDAETDKPIEGAAVAVHYYTYKFFTIPGLGSGYTPLTNQETVSDAEGYFTVEKIFSERFRMCVYKDGYVCWYSRIKFPSLEKRKIVSIGNGKKIKLDQFKEEYSVKEHAFFTVDAAIDCRAGATFYKAINKENELHTYFLRGGLNER